ncbi:type I site-specific deoxyribonuclease, HsdR family [Tessaracoccus bendigoensis DSM 12906]|uniref:Type I restriction enzyme endonuclease subunit n=1 Tax=Tessaracoccus bendigoensis DSM 12906 TaxID=1123357 RepID=A0A1M6G4X9_9ACTN|nr:type I restriction endonuclease subunit R [Tessaracoccus bendigoensis]SHJ05018.1 type I site-specific deoxyribonuclease, HsdR family [Tessaracoccus bendigoensis DSM 12906]
MTNTAPRYEPIAVSDESTVVAEYVPEPGAAVEYQSEAQLEAELLRLLEAQAYEYLPITSEADLVANLRAQLEALNAVEFSDAEWQRFFEQRIAGRNDGIVEKTVRIQEDHIQLLKRDDGTTRNIRLLDKTSIHNNRLQVINQYEVPGAGPAVDAASNGAGRATFANRYDVTVLVNGLPMVHIELKRRGVDIREAFNQIDRYQRDSFWAGSGLFEYVQLFVISNGTLTKYYSNTTRRQHLKEGQKPGRARRTSNSFEFTSWWADARNRPIQELSAFAATFFARHTLLSILTRYCVLTDDRLLLVMRPYQIVAAEQILRRIDIATNYKRLGTVAAGGYVWHTTGSGKTLTSFKAAQLACRLPGISRVLFVVDRKDLDYQTMREYDRFQKGAANSNTSTAVLKRQLEDPGARIIITTIQKLSSFVKANKAHPVYDEHVVIVFDECHRSQFGDMHTDITRAFRRYHLFGFTGTPIFAANSGSGGNPQLKTTGRRSVTGCTPTPSSMPSRIRTCCRSASTTSTQCRWGRSPTSRSPRSRPRRRCSTRVGSATSSATRWNTSTRRPGEAPPMSIRWSPMWPSRPGPTGRRRRSGSVGGCGGSTRSSPPRRSMRPSATTRHSSCSRRTCRRIVG